MDSKTEKKMLKDMKKMKKKELREMCQNLAAEHAAVRQKIKTIESARGRLEKTLFDAIDAKDEATTEITKSKMSVMKDELERLTKREKSLAEELELASRASKNDFEGKSSAWTTVGAWIVGIGTTALSAWGLVKSHKSFETGEMVDKGTKSMAERMSGLFSFMTFRR